MLMILARMILRTRRMRLMATWLTTSQRTLWPPPTSSIDLSWQQKQKTILKPNSNRNDRLPPVMQYSTMQNLVFPIKVAYRFNITKCVVWKLHIQDTLFKGHAVKPNTHTSQGHVRRLFSSPRTVISESLSLLVDLPNSSLVLVTLVFILLVLLIITCHLLNRLEELQKKVESSLQGRSETTMKQLVGWQNVLYSQSSNKIQEYIQNNLQQIAKVSFIPIFLRLTSNIRRFGKIWIDYLNIWNRQP